ncbi:MAG: DUF1059 domain-containing protein [Bacteroidota bacterium]|jgi:hypothetical protein
MKTMSCQQLGGACNLQFHAATFEEMAQMSQQHGKEMFQKGDAPHIEAMNAMRDMMQKPDAMQAWFESKKKEFEMLPEEN